MDEDATVIDLCASLFDWAKFRQTKGAVKLHVLLDHDGYLPVFAHLTKDKSHELLMAHKLRLPKGSIVAMRYIGERFRTKATPSLPGIIEAPSSETIFDGMEFQRLRLHHDQQVPEWG